MPNILHLFARDEILPSYWPNALQRRLSASVSQLALTKNSNTALQIVAGAGDDLVAVDIKGLWRYIEATITAAHPGGVAGTYDVYVTASNQNIVGSPAPNTDSTNYAFAMQIKPLATPPTIVAGTVDVYRKIGQVVWDGAAIRSITQLVGFGPFAPVAGVAQVGALATYAGVGDPPVGPDGAVWLLADGRLVSKATYAEYFARAGHAYNLGVDPGGGNVKLPDKRGRVSVGQDNMGTAQGAAGRLPNTNRALGQNHGEERHQQSLSELVSHTHQYTVCGIVATIDGGSFANVSNVLGTANTGAAGGNVAANIVQPGEVDNVIVRVA